MAVGQEELAKNKEERLAKYRDQIPKPSRGEGSDKLIDEEMQAVGIIGGRVYGWYFGFAGIGLCFIIHLLLIRKKQN